MFKFLFIMFLFFLLLVFLAGFSILRAFKNMLFGGGESSHTKSSRKRRDDGSRRRQNTSQGNNGSPTRGKIFPKDEGEYVDFEEIKQ